MSLIEQAKKDIEQITSNSNDFGVSIILTSPSNQTITITGLHTKIHLGVDTDGNVIQSKKAHISFSEQFLIDGNYTTRNTQQEVNLINHKVEVVDSTGISKKYIIQSAFPDETIGLICCILNDLE